MCCMIMVWLNKSLVFLIVFVIKERVLRVFLYLVVFVVCFLLFSFFKCFKSLLKVWIIFDVFCIDKGDLGDLLYKGIRWVVIVIVWDCIKEFNVRLYIVEVKWLIRLFVRRNFVLWEVVVRL